MDLDLAAAVARRHAQALEDYWRTAESSGAPLAASRRIAAVACLGAAELGVAPAALAPVAAAAVDRLGNGYSAASLKKHLSEARAVLAHARCAGATGQDLAAVATIVADISLAEARRQRAQALAGRKGGRPRTGRRKALDAVRRLLARSEQGDAVAHAELREIEAAVARAHLARAKSRPIHVRSEASTSIQVTPTA
ncbi:MAG: hypothetical protein ACK41C_17840 [Phenylobacterium sp.]|uniref:hypothetical protein n=1 Tax=Phenylobacterium sp. TaxID=1871053 RepID=UPI00391B50AE